MKPYIPYIMIFLGSLTFSVWFFMPQEVFIKGSCDIGKENCLLEKDGVSLKFSTSENPIKQLKPVHYFLKISGVKNPIPKIYLYGQSMNMVTEIIEMKKVDEGTFEAVRDFPVCTEKSMIWRAHLSIKGDKKLIKTNFIFEVKK